MSIHAEISEEVQEKLKKQKATSTLVSFLSSITIIGILTALLAVLTIIIPSKEIETIISYKAPPVDQDLTDKVVIEKVVRQTPTPPAASSAVANVITTSAPTAISIPDTNDFVADESVNFGSSADFGMGFGDSPEETAMEGFTLFGAQTNTGIAGHIYDMKKKRTDKTQTDLFNKIKDITVPPYSTYIRSYLATDEAKSLAKAKYEQSSLKNYFKSQEQLNFTFLVIEKTQAEVGPESFKAEKDIEPRTWFAVYEGVFAEAPRKPFRFLGRFDDVLIVYINDEVVFDGSYNSGYSDSFSKMDKNSQLPKVRGILPTVTGPYITPKAGDEIRIVVAEIPGGYLGGGLFVEEEGTVSNPSMLTPFVTIPVEGEVKKILSEKQVSLNLEDVPVYRFKN